MKTTEEKKSWLQKRGWFKSKEDYDRNIHFEKQEDKIIMTDIDTEEAIIPTKLEEDFPDEEKEPRDYLVEMKPKERHETSTNDDLRNKRKVVSFVSGDDYQALERELWEKNIQLEEIKKRVEDVEKKLQEIKKIIS